MKKMVFLGWLILFLPAMVFAQEKVEAPVWNVGDKWVFTGDGIIEVFKADQSGYILKLSDKNCPFERQDCSTILFDKSTRNRIYAIEGEKRKKYRMGLMKILDFPLSSRKQWKWSYPFTIRGMTGTVVVDCFEDHRVLGWEDIEVRAGKFRALKLEYKRKAQHTTWTGPDIISLYWYSPDVKYFVKCQYDKGWIKDQKDIFNWELASFQLKK